MIFFRAGQIHVPDGMMASFAYFPFLRINQTKPDATAEITTARISHDVNAGCSTFAVIAGLAGGALAAAGALDVTAGAAALIEGGAVSAVGNRPAFSAAASKLPASFNLFSCEEMAST